MGKINAQTGGAANACPGQVREHQRPSRPALTVYSTRYSRGSVVKLAASLSDQPLVKFVIERKHGQAGIRISLADELGTEVQTPVPGLTEAQFIEYAERECERIRRVLGGCDGGR